ncbi:MAG: hypothetical protein WC667_11780 [Sulfurimonas sp.]|jgi:hypothetical protein
MRKLFLITSLVTALIVTTSSAKFGEERVVLTENVLKESKGVAWYSNSMISAVANGVHDNIDYRTDYCI